jgi:hypothetical protein
VHYTSGGQVSLQKIFKSLLPHDLRVRARTGENDHFARRTQRKPQRPPSAAAGKFPHLRQDFRLAGETPLRIPIGEG